MDKKKCHATNLGTTVTDLTGTVHLRARVKEHPYGTLAAAMGVGYVLAGGLFTRLTARTVKLGVRVGASLAVWPLLEKELASLAEAFKASRADHSTQAAGHGPGRLHERHAKE